MLRPLEMMQVVSVDATKRRLGCQFQSGTGPGVSVRMANFGPADGVRVRQTPMPQQGTWGLIAFPGGDSRSGVWLCSVYTSDVDAYTGDGDPYTDYHSHWSGAYDLLDGNGQKFGGLPDGTYWSHSVTPGPPALNTHVVNTTQNRVAQAVTPASLVTTAPSARPFRYHHASGTQIDIDSNGNVTITLASGAGITSGNGTWDHTGDFNLTGNFTNTENVTVGTGASGTFSTPTGQTVTVRDGIITNIY